MFKIAFLEFKNNKNYKKIAIALNVCMTLIMLIVASNLTLRNITKNIIENEYSLLSAYSNVYEESKNFNFDYDFVSDFREYNLYSHKTNSYKIIIDGKENLYSSMTFCMGVDVNKDILSVNERIHYESITNKDVIKYGRKMESENEILITEGLVKELGLDPKDVVGKKIDIKSDVTKVFSGFDFIKGFKICGVLNDDILKVSFLSINFIMMTDNYSNEHTFSRYITKVDFKDFNDLDNRIETLNNGDLTFTKSYDIIEDYVKKVEAYSDYILTIVTIFTCMIVVGIIAYILSMLIMNYKNSKINNHILYSYGLKRKVFVDIIILSIINIISFVISFIIMLFILFLIELLINEIIIEVRIIKYGKIILSYFLIFIAFEMVLVLSNYLYLRYQKIMNN